MHRPVLAFVVLVAPAAVSALGQDETPRVAAHARALSFPDLSPPTAVAPGWMSTAISANGEIVMVSLSDPPALETSGPSSDPAGTWVHDVGKGETRELHMVRDGKPWRLIGRSALSADGRFVASACAPDLGPPPKWSPGMTPVKPVRVATLALIELASGQTRVVDLGAHGCNAPLAEPDRASLSADGTLLAISTTPDFGHGVPHGWAMVWNQQDDSLRPLGLDDAYYGLMGPELSADGCWLIGDSFSKGNEHPAGLFRIDHASGASGLASLAPDQRQLVALPRDHSLGADGQRVAFVAQDEHAKDPKREDVFVRDLAAGTTSCASVAPDGTDANGTSSACALSGDGRYVAFVSRASNLVQPADDALPDLFVRELASGRTIRVGVEDIAPGERTIFLPALSGNGHRVVFCVGAQQVHVVLADIDWPAASTAVPH